MREKSKVLQLLNMRDERREELGVAGSKSMPVRKININIDLVGTQEINFEFIHNFLNLLGETEDQVIKRIFLRGLAGEFQYRRRKSINRDLTK